MEIINMAIENITPYENNPRLNDAAVDKVANSIREFGFKQPIVVDKDHVIIVGHTRLKAAKQLGLTTVPVLVAKELTDDQVKAYRLADNKTSEFAEWDDELLIQELQQLGQSNLEDYGFDVETLLGTDLVEEDMEENQEIDLEEEPISKPGDLYRLGDHYLMCGDSTEASAVEKLMQGHEADLVVTDPPYNVAYEGGVSAERKAIENDDMSDDDFVAFLTPVFKNLKDALKMGGEFLHLAR